MRHIWLVFQESVLPELEPLNLKYHLQNFNKFKIEEEEVLVCTN
jgi:hypothetical protein